MNYSALAPIYDRLMAHVGYYRWHVLIEQVVQRYCETRRPSIFEIGAGTGVLGERLLSAGFPYLGSDLSFPMCRQARTRLARILCADGRCLPLKDNVRFDIILFLYDGINYFMKKEEYEEMFEQAYGHLNRGGLFLFDVTTVFNSVNNFNEYVDADDFGDFFYFRHSYFNSSKSTQYNDFTIFRRLDVGRPANGAAGAAMLRDGTCALYEKSMERHEQKVFPVKIVRDYVPRNLFDILGIWDNFSFKKHTARAERVHFLLRKKDAG